jgi:NADH-quinone oxidoreductase subunit J
LTDLFSPILLYGGCALGAIGVCLALPRRGLSPQIVGGIIAAIAFGGIMLALAAKAGDGGLPNFNYYVFSLIALGSALRVISHPRPVYAALYFVLTILASSGLYLILSAEFMAFALVIVYAGAILITYLFVIMLATETPTAEQVDALAEYDRYSREPVLATVTGFVLVAVLATLLGRGAAGLTPPARYEAASHLADLPGRVEAALRREGTIRPGERLAMDRSYPPRPMVDVKARTATLTSAAAPVAEDQEDPTLREVPLPAGLSLTNTEGVAFALLGEHPGAIEMAGVVLLMAMLGAVVLARKKVELDERARAAAARRLSAAAAVPGGAT